VYSNIGCLNPTLSYLLYLNGTCLKSGNKNNTAKFMPNRGKNLRKWLSNMHILLSQARVVREFCGQLACTVAVIT